MFENCPKCGSTKFHSSNANIEEGTVWFKLKCDSCGFMWNEVWSYSHAENPDTGERLNEFPEIENE